MSAHVLKAALAHHRAGRLAEAEELYRRLLADDPRNADALNLLGVVADANGDTERGAELVAQAIAVRDFPRFRNNLGMMLGKLGRHQAALEAYAEALAQWPDYPEALNNRGATLEALGRPEEAAASFRAATAARPDYAEAWGNLGNALRQLGEPKEAESAYERALAFNRGAAVYEAGLGAALLSQGRMTDAEAAYRRQLELTPDDPEALNNLAAAFNEQKRNAEAEQVLSRAVALAPERSETWRNLGAVLHKLGRLGEAEVACRQAVALRPDYPDALDVLGTVLRELGRLEEAEVAQRRVIARHPASARAYRNLALTLEDQKRHHEAMALLDLAIGLAPGDADARHHRSLILLRQGRLSEGWTEYEARFQTTQGRPHQREFSVPQWRGEKLDGRTILLHAEQGFGDTIQFVRYAPMVVARGGHVLLHVPSRLRRLLSSLPGVSVMLPTDVGDLHRLRHEPAGTDRPAFDLHCPLLSLPLAFGTTLDSIPAAGPYLRPPEEPLRHWRARLPPTAQRRVGIVWAGNPRHGSDRQRSLPFSALAALWDVANISWVSLQIGPRAEDLQQLPAGVVDDISAEQTDFADTAAALSRLDLVIAADTAVAHLAGACGVPVWTMLMLNADWRWLADGETTPWYPTMRLFRQEQDRAWEPVVQKVADALSVWSPTVATKATDLSVRRGGLCYDQAVSFADSSTQPEQPAVTSGKAS